MIPIEVRLWRSNESCRVVNKYNSEYDVNIQRGTIWGNPYSTDEYGDQAIPLFKKYFNEQIKSGTITKNHLEVLRGMRLGCTCHPKQCHGDYIAYVVNRVFKDQFMLEDLM